MNAPKRSLPKLGTRERIKLDAFLGGFCCCLSAAFYGDDGTSTYYVEAVSTCGGDDLLAYARRERDMELPNIRRAVKEIRRRESLERRAAQRRLT